MRHAASLQSTFADDVAVSSNERLLAERNAERTDYAADRSSLSGASSLSRFRTVLPVEVN